MDTVATHRGSRQCKGRRIRFRHEGRPRLSTSGFLTTGQRVAGLRCGRSLEGRWWNVLFDPVDWVAWQSFSSLDAGNATTVSLRPYDHVEATPMQPQRWMESRRVNKCASLEAWRQPKTSVIRTREK